LYVQGGIQKKIVKPQVIEEGTKEVEKQIIQEEPQPDPEIPVVVKSKISEESKIQELNEKIDDITRWLGLVDVEYNLAYRGS
jgi:hypothetical protein